MVIYSMFQYVLIIWTVLLILFPNWNWTYFILCLVEKLSFCHINSLLLSSTDQSYDIMNHSKQANNICSLKNLRSTEFFVRNVLINSDWIGKTSECYWLCLEIMNYTHDPTLITTPLLRKKKRVKREYPLGWTISWSVKSFPCWKLFQGNLLIIPTKMLPSGLFTCQMLAAINDQT